MEAGLRLVPTVLQALSGVGVLWLFSGDAVKSISADESSAWDAVGEGKLGVSLADIEFALASTGGVVDPVESAARSAAGCDVDDRLQLFASGGTAVGTDAAAAVVATGNAPGCDTAEGPQLLASLTAWNLVVVDIAATNAGCDAAVAPEFSASLTALNVAGIFTVSCAELRNAAG